MDRRLSWRTVAVYLVFLFLATPNDEREAIGWARIAGVADARAAIARGRPWIHTGTWAKGVGLDTETGLPFERAPYPVFCRLPTTRADGAWTETYLETIRAAHARGDLERFRLDGKLRTPSALRDLFAAGTTRRLDAHGLVLDDGTTLGYLGEWLHVAPPGAGRFSLAMAVGGRYHGGARGPFDVLVVDDGTTAILRDRDRCAWLLDLTWYALIQVVDLGGPDA